MAEKLWTCVARCQVCGRELNRACGVPESAKASVAIGAPLNCICPVKGHNTLSDCNIGVELEWIEGIEEVDVTETHPSKANNTSPPPAPAP